MIFQSSFTALPMCSALKNLAKNMKKILAQFGEPYSIGHNVAQNPNEFSHARSVTNPFICTSV